jgi:threonine/homoserine/homoserine lactone efflux protein
MNYHLFSAFLLITFVLVIVPGPIVTLIIATGATRGWCCLADYRRFYARQRPLLACIALGLNWILKTSSEVFEVMRWIGAAYLVWLGIQSWRHAGINGGAVSPRGHVYLWRGFAVAMTNPKTIAFFTAFLPQFVDPNLPVGYQLAVMCTISVAMAAVIDILRTLNPLRRSPIIVISARKNPVDRVVGLELGADDYVCKPFHLREVLARAKKVLRPLSLLRDTAANDGGAATLCFEGWRAILERRQLISPDGRDVPLTGGEFKLLAVFLKNPGRVLSRQHPWHRLACL